MARPWQHSRCDNGFQHMLDLKALLEMADIDLAETLVVRHVPVEKSLKRILPWLVVERPELWRTYQQIQWESLEKAMTRGTYIASFIGQDAGTATFAGFYRIGPWSTLDLAGYNSFPGNGELKALGMSGRSPDMPDCLAFDLDPTGDFDDWIGRLTIQWPKPYQKWWRWGASGSFPVLTIEAESRFVHSSRLNARVAVDDIVIGADANRRHHPKPSNAVGDKLLLTSRMRPRITRIRLQHIDRHIFNRKYRHRHGRSPSFAGLSRWRTPFDCHGTRYLHASPSLWELRV